MNFLRRCVWSNLSPLLTATEEIAHEKLAEKIKQIASGKKTAAVPVPVEHPNFWMYQ